MSEAAPTVVIAPDSFKGSCSSVEAARAIARGVRAAFGTRAEVLELPMADGGEGTLDALVAACAADDDCHARYPDLRKELLDVLSHAADSPFSVTVTDAVMTSPMSTGRVKRSDCPR